MVHLTPEQVQFYKDNGYILLKGVVKGKDLEELSREYDNLFKRKSDSKTESAWVGRVHNHRISDSPYTVKGIHNLQYHHAIFGKVLYNEDLLDGLEDCMGTKNIAIHHTMAHFKPPKNGAAYPMHQDYWYFPYKNDTMTAAFMHLDDSGPENGGLFVYPGSHKLGALPDQGALDGSDFHYVDQKQWPIEKATPIIAKAGDVAIFSYFTIHGSSANLSDRPRRMYLSQFQDVGDEAIGGEAPQPGKGWLFRGANVNRDATLTLRAVEF